MALTVSTDESADYIGIRSKVSSLRISNDH